MPRSTSRSQKSELAGIRANLVLLKTPKCRDIFIGAARFELATFRPPAERATKLRHAPGRDESTRNRSERATGLEPALRPWKGLVQPLHHAREPALDYRFAPAQA